MGNKDKSGEAIIAAAPVESKSSMQLLGHQGENPVIVESTVCITALILITTTMFKQAVSLVLLQVVKVGDLLAVYFCSVSLHFRSLPSCHAWRRGHAVFLF